MHGSGRDGTGLVLWWSTIIWQFSKHYNVQDTENCYEHTNTLTDRKTTNPLGMVVGAGRELTDYRLTDYRQDVIIKDHQTSENTLGDIGVPWNRSVSIKTTEELSKYRDLVIEAQSMQKMITKIVIINPLHLINIRQQATWSTEGSSPHNLFPQKTRWPREQCSILFEAGPPV